MTGARVRALGALAVLGALTGLGLGCADSGSGDGGDERCGPTEATITRVIDGDTVELDVDGDDGEPLRVRYLMIDTPESTGGDVECFGPEAKELNQLLAEGQTVTLRYDAECEDAYGRLLAYVELPSGQDINRVLIERGYACVLHIPPNGDAVVDEYEDLEANAKAQSKGLWGACTPSPC